MNRTSSRPGFFDLRPVLWVPILAFCSWSAFVGAAWVLAQVLAYLTGLVAP